MLRLGRAYQVILARYWTGRPRCLNQKGHGGHSASTHSTCRRLLYGNLFLGTKPPNATASFSSIELVDLWSLLILDLIWYETPFSVYLWVLSCYRVSHCKCACQNGCPSTMSFSPGFPPAPLPSTWRMSYVSVLLVFPTQIQPTARVYVCRSCLFCAWCWYCYRFLAPIYYLS